MADPVADAAAREEKGNPLVQVPIEVMVAVGRARPSVQELLSLSRDSVLALDKGVDDPIELFVGDRLIGIGTLEVLGEGDTAKLAVRIQEVISPKGGL